MRSVSGFIKVGRYGDRFRTERFHFLPFSDTSFRFLAALCGRALWVLPVHLFQRAHRFEANIFLFSPIFIFPTANLRVHATARNASERLKQNPFALKASWSHGPAEYLSDPKYVPYMFRSK